MLKKILLIVLLSTLSWSCPRAAVISNLYEAEVAVEDQSQESYQDALTRALHAVLVKLTGERDVQGRQVTAYLLNNPQLYVQQYKYRNKAVQEKDRLTLKNELYLWVRFNEAALTRVFRDYQVPVWGNVRPNTLIWVLVESDGKRQFISLEDEQGFTGFLEDRARQRGVPLSYPLFDEADRAAVEQADVWGGFVEPVKWASRRYNPNAILMGSVFQVSAREWAGRWTAIVDDRSFNWTQSGEGVSQVLSEAADYLADLLADRYVQSASDLQDTLIEVTVNDIYNYEQHARVLKYFRSLSNVSEVNIKSLQPGSVTFTIVTAGSDEQGIRQTVQLGRTLEPIAGRNDLYRLIR